MKVLLHTCCGPCASACVPRLKEEGHEVTLFYSNSNIDTEEEFAKRFVSAKRLAESDGVAIAADRYDHKRWLKEVAKGYEDAPEKGARCARCFAFSLKRTAEYARANGFDAFATSLTVSPHKISKVVFAASGDPKFLHEDFKKREGFKISVKRAAELGLYRQNYCGCEFSKKTTLALVSLGCAKNAVDLQVRAGALLKKGYALSPDPDRADVAIVNTCAFIASAREEAESEITRALALKAKGNYGKVVVTGCYPERYPKAKAKFPGVDSWEGVPSKWEEPAVPELRFTGKAFAYLKIAEGCAHRCSYCAIPAIRGKFRSRPMESILAEAKALLKSGCRELDIVAQDPMLYGCDMKPRKSLTELLWALDSLPGKFWVRVLYSYPSEITEEFLDWLNSSRHAVKYVDIPLQHTVPEVLERMNRKSAIEASLVAAEALRLAVPGVTLRTTVMTGFPGETESRFRRMRSDLKRMQFDRLGAFAYSPEKGTKGAKMGGRPSRKTAEERERLVMEDAAKLWRVKAAKLVGQEFDSLCVAPGVVRMASQAPDVDGVTYLLDSPKARSVKPGEFVRVRIISASGFDFEAEAL